MSDADADADARAAAVEAEVRELLGDAYDSPDARVRYWAVREPAAFYADLAARLAEVKAIAVDDLTPSGTNVSALADELKMKRQRLQQLKANARGARIREAQKRAAVARARGEDAPVEGPAA